MIVRHKKEQEKDW